MTLAINCKFINVSRKNHWWLEYVVGVSLFLEPTQIYRFLRNRHLTSPIFLSRSLSYMKERMSRSNKCRNNFKINNMLGTLLARHKQHNLTNNYLNVVFNGLFTDTDNCNNLLSSSSISSSLSSNWQCGDMVTIDAGLCKITKSKRKDSTSDFQEIWVSMHILYICKYVFSLIIVLIYKEIFYYLTNAHKSNNYMVS